MKTYYYYQALRKTITQFLDVFNDIKIKRYDESGNFVRYITIPIKFAPKERAYYYIFENHQDEMLPMISVTMNSIEFASDRMGSNYHVLTKSMEDCQVSRFLNPVPYNLGFTVYLWTKYMSDIDQILEQVLAYFAPHIFIRIKIPEVDFSFDVKIVFTGASPDMQTDMGEEERRIIRYTMDFSVHTYLFRPVEDTGVIETIYINYYLKNNLLADTTSLFTSAASGESQVFTGLGLCTQEEDEKIYSYELYNYGRKIGPPLLKLIMPEGPSEPETTNASVNLSYSDLIAGVLNPSITTISNAFANLNYNDIVADILNPSVTVDCVGYESGTSAIENFNVNNSMEFNSGSDYFQVETGQYLAITQSLSPTASYDLTYNASSDNPFTLEYWAMGGETWELVDSWEATLGEIYTVTNAEVTTTLGTDFFTVLKNTHDSCSVINVTPTSELHVDEGGETQNHETAQDAMEWAEDNLTHDGYNTEEDKSVMTVASGSYGAIYYYNLVDDGAVWDGYGSTIQSTDGDPGDDYYWASYIKTGINAYSLQWSGTMLNASQTVWNITPWHWELTLFVVRNDSPNTRTYSIKLVQGDVVA